MMDAVLDAGRLRGQSLLVCVCTFSVMILDGLDIQIIGFAAPALVAEFRVERSALGLALAASVLGMSLGAMAIGRIGDRFGRRPALLLSTVLFGATTLLGATASDVTSLASWRFLTGLGLGGAMPSAVAIMAEFAPARLRSQLIVGSLLGVPIGGILGAALAAELVPVFGWRAIFIAGGLLPLVAAAALLPLLPESPRFLAARGDRKPAADEGCAFHAMFSPALARDTWVMALAFFTNMIAVYAFFSWVPLVLTSVGFPLDQAVRSGLVFNLAGVVGSLLNAWLIARIGSRLPLVAVCSVAVFALVGLTCVAALGDQALQSQRNVTIYFIAVAAAGFGIHALQSGLYIVSAHVFPTECRTSGVGFASGAGRIGGILSSFAGGSLLAMGGASGFFLGLAMVLVLAMACLLALRRHVRSPSQAAITSCS
jgi:MFS transporter, AAHS family, 4-hydroxybenzoate transporter